MTNEANNIARQAKQGSVAAIIQVLNDKLADSGVRTRAIFADGVLQLLCEGVTLEQLEKIPLVEQVRQILEAIAPRNIRRVKINGRIVREQQLLWLDEINRDPEHQLLWSEEILLKKPNFFKQFMDDWSDRDSEQGKADLSKVSPSKTLHQRRQEKRQFWMGLTGGAIASCLLLVACWMLYERFSLSNTGTLQLKNKPASSGQTVNSTNSGANPAPSNAVSSASISSSPTTDPFADAVRLAERTSQASQTAKSSADWLSLATDWQKASDLMARVPETDSRYKTAQDRVAKYQENSEMALQKAKQIQSSGPESTIPASPTNNDQAGEAQSALSAPLPTSEAP
jgi:Tfp pilus assembly protein PilN